MKSSHPLKRLSVTSLLTDNLIHKYKVSQKILHKIGKFVNYKIKFHKRKKSCSRKSGRFFTARAAKVKLSAIRELNPNIDLRIYKCDECKYFHFTSQSPSEYARSGQKYFERREAVTMVTIKSFFMKKPQVKVV